MRRKYEAVPQWAQPSEINLGDYVRACKELDAAPEVCVAIGRLLGIAGAIRVEQEALPEQSDEGPGFTAVVGKAGAGGEGTGGGVQSPPQQKVPAVKLRQKVVRPTGDTREIPAELTLLGQAEADFSLKQLPDIPADSLRTAPPEFPPLFPPQQTRTLLSRALARRAYTGPWDLTRIIEQCARGEAITEAPRLPEPTLSGGVQLLVDRSDAMMVFSQDQSSLEQAIRKLLGQDKLQVLSFEAFPSRAGSGGKRRWRPYDQLLPQPGTVIAILSDLGIGHAPGLSTGAAPAKWRAFAQRLRRRGCPVMAFVPYHPLRWPAELRGALTIIHWDRPTQLSAIRPSVGVGLQVEN